MGFCGDLFFGARALHHCLRPLWQDFASSGDIGCGEAAWPDILIMAAACEHYLLKLRPAVAGTLPALNARKLLKIMKKNAKCPNFTETGFENQSNGGNSMFGLQHKQKTMKQ